MGYHGPWDEVHLVPIIVEPPTHIDIGELKAEFWVNDVCTNCCSPPYKARYRGLLYFYNTSHIDTVIPIAFKVTESEHIFINHSSKNRSEKEKERCHDAAVVELQRTILIQELCRCAAGVRRGIHERG